MYYQYTIAKSEKPESWLVCGGEDTLEKCKESMQKTADYYKNELGYSLHIEIKKVCSTCFNEGKYFKRQKRNHWLGKWIVCPECKGKIPDEKYIIEQ